MRTETPLLLATPIPERLQPYLDDLLETGLWGTSRQECVVRLVERSIEYEIERGMITPRVNGQKLDGGRPCDESR